ncbi:hypothetical protein PVAND_013526 [Polypedilum vanderplanki]|uniref:Uncharacterized protein n=1 Tax=Polypedilum vanderplanki TaxID=319348 RepID=A0A9J6CPQ1_POLVA|nr:hypothetical protein PVAND_013526 [Polypedilum vanderplanki]
MWNYEEIGHNMALKMAVIDQVCEPTLAQIQKDAEKSVHGDENLFSIPAWKYYSKPFLGFPEHYIAAQRFYEVYNKINMNLTSTNEDDLQLPIIPYSLVNHEVHFKLIITFKQHASRLPTLYALRNGTIIITSNFFPTAIQHNVEIYVHFQNKLLPCCFTIVDNVIVDSPLTRNARARCYYVVEPKAVVEATFIDENQNVICRCDYSTIPLHGSNSYQEICEVIRSQNVTLNEKKPL